MITPLSPQIFDEAEKLIELPVYSVGYHTKFRPPHRAHGTRESADFAIQCLASADKHDQERGRAILDRILSLQVTDPTALHFGIWGWFAEEPPQEMAPADWNWADFIGTRLAEIIAGFPHLLSPGLRERMRAAIDRAAWAIFRRNVGPSYTNICAMGAVVCIGWGEMAPEPRLLDYGVRRLANMRRELEFNGGFPEYNSPHYSTVVLEELERLLQIVKHPQARADAEAILAATWRLIADQFHPGTQQWAGPQSRCYSDWLTVAHAHLLGERIGAPVSVRTPDDPVPEPIGAIKTYPCPEAIRPRFAKLPASPHQHRQTWMKNADGTPALFSTTWFTDEATLGSINRETTWIQRKVVLGYWRTADDFAARFRLRLLHNGRDFASGYTWSEQEGPRVLTGFHFIIGDGDFHPNLDVPADGIFHTRDLRIRYEVEGKGATARELRCGVFELAVGSHKVIVHAGPIRFDGKDVTQWICGSEGDLVWVEGIFHAGSERAFHPAQMGESTAAAALELLRREESPATGEIGAEIEAGQRRFQWLADRAYSVAVPTAAIKKLVP